MTTQELEKRIADNQAKLEKREKLHQKRIAKLEKLEPKLQEIESTKTRNDFTNEDWELLWDVEHLQDSTKEDARKIKDFKRKIDKYQAQLDETIKKANSRNVKVILDFLENWKKEAREYYHDMVPKYREATRKFNQEKHDYKERWDFNKRWAWLEDFMYGWEIDDDRLNKALTREAETKYDNLVAKIFDVVGEIKDASYLYIADNGQLNGYVIGENGKAVVETIGAGGYNVQRFHYRTLVKKCA